MIDVTRMNVVIEIDRGKAVGGGTIGREGHLQCSIMNE